MPVARILTKEMVIAAMNKTKSVRSAARYLNCSYTHLKKYMKAYVDEATGKSLFEVHKNQSGKGIPKHSLTDYGRIKKEPHVSQIVSGEADASYFTPEKLKHRMIEFGYLKEECYACGFNERRVIDFKIPLLMHFVDGNKKHFGMGNVQMLCYNCYFLLSGNIFTQSELETLEDGKPRAHNTERVNMELDPYHLEKLRELGLYEDNIEDDTYSLVSRKK